MQAFMIKQELEYHLLKIIEQQPNITQRRLADELGVSLGKTHYLIKSLVDMGWIKQGNIKRADNKWGYAYLITPKGVSEKAEITLSFLVRRQQEYKELGNEIIRLQNEVEEVHKGKDN